MSIIPRLQWMYPTKQIPNGLPKIGCEKSSKPNHRARSRKNLSSRENPSGLEKIIFVGQRGFLPQDKVEGRRNTWCISRSSKRSVAGKGPLIRPKRIFESPHKIKRGGAKHRPAHKPLLLLQNCSASLRRTEPCGPLHGGGREHYGRWKMPFSGGSHEPWNDDDGWADRYASCGTPPSCVSSMLDSRIRLQQSIVSDHR